MNLSLKDESMLSVIERSANISNADQGQLDRLNEQINTANELGMKGVAWSLQMRYKFSLIKALKYPVITEKQIADLLIKKLKLKKDHEWRLAWSPLGDNDTNGRYYAGNMPYGCLLRVKELVDAKLVQLGELVVFYPKSEKILKDPIMCIRFPDMDILDNFSAREEGSQLPCKLFKVWQWD